MTYYGFGVLYGKGFRGLGFWMVLEFGFRATKGPSFRQVVWGGLRLGAQVYKGRFEKVLLPLVLT